MTHSSVFSRRHSTPLSHRATLRDYWSHLFFSCINYLVMGADAFHQSDKIKDILNLESVKVKRGVWNLAQGRQGV